MPKASQAGSPNRSSHNRISAGAQTAGSCGRPANPWEPVLDWGILANSVGPRIRLVRNHLHQRSIAVSKPFDLPTGTLTLLALIQSNPGSSQRELADWAGITGPGLVGIIDDLEKRGMVRRVRSTKDRRRNSLELTELGTRTMNLMFDTVSTIEEPIRQALSPEELATFVAMIERIAVALEESDI